MKIKLEQIVPNPDQPRSVFDDGEIEVLAESLKQHGLLNPIAVEGPYDGHYIILDGERRVRAARLAGWDVIDVSVKASISENGSGRLMMALVGNLQRSDMGPVDEARAYAKLREKMSVREICDRVGRSDAHVYTRLGMLEWGLAEEILELVNLRHLPSDAKALRPLSELPYSIQIPLARRAARSRCSASRLKGLCTRALKSQPIHCVQRPTWHSKTDPINAPALIGWNNDIEGPPGKIQEAIVTTCKKCGMGDDRFNTLCRDCPLTHFVRLISEDVSNP